MKARYYFTFVRSLRLFKRQPLSGFCQQKKWICKMAGVGDFKDFGPLVGAIDQGTSSSRFLVSNKFILRKKPCGVICRLGSSFPRSHDNRGPSSRWPGLSKGCHSISKLDYCCTHITLDCRDLSVKRPEADIASFRSVG